MIMLEVTAMTIGGKRPRGRPRLIGIERVQCDKKEHQLDPKLVQPGEMHS